MEALQQQVELLLCFLGERCLHTESFLPVATESFSATSDMLSASGPVMG